MNENSNAIFLNFIRQNSTMGVTTINQLLDIVEDEAFRKHLEKELEEYCSYHEEAKKLLNDHGFDEKGLTMFEKIRTYLMISVQTITDKFVPHIAEMMVTDSNIGALNATEYLEDADHVEWDVRSLMEDLLKFEEKSMQKLKEFL